MFALARYPGVEALGVFPASSMEYQRVRGWYRISEWRESPSEFHHPDFADAVTDLDAEPEVLDTPAVPEKDEESE